MQFDAALAIWIICALAVACVIVRPFGVAEWLPATLGALLLSFTGLIPVAMAWQGVASGIDVYLFLAGMMLLAEVARREGLFDYLAAFAARASKGSPTRLFLLIYLVGTLVTIFLSNDATAVVLTPAVAAVARAAEARSPMPYLLVCAFVANAASFALPISNPANLVVFGSEMPPLADWLSRFALPSLLSITATYAVLRATQGKMLQGQTRQDIAIPLLSTGGRIVAIGIVLAALVLIAASALGFNLGWPTALAGILTVLGVLIGERSSPWPVLRRISWDTLVLVAALFVIVQALDLTGLKTVLSASLEAFVARYPDWSTAAVGAILALGTNLTNNLPLGLVAGSVGHGADVPSKVMDAALIGIDIGPNLSVTGSLATILWLTALRREGLSFGAVRFLKIGILVMPPALFLALAASML